jgi:hypothetical protein
MRSDDDLPMLRQLALPTVLASVDFVDNVASGFGCVLQYSGPFKKLATIRFLLCHPILKMLLSLLTTFSITLKVTHGALAVLVDVV